MSNGQFVVIVATLWLAPKATEKSANLMAAAAIAGYILGEVLK